MAPAVADTVTLDSGEVLQGRILSETDTQLIIEVSLYHGTILTKREVLKSDIRSVVRDSPAQQQEKADFEALAKYTLNPNQELTKDQYAAGIAAFQRFLTTHANSTSAQDVDHRLADWQAEAANVDSGKVKYAGKWMTPDEKRVQVGQAALLSLQKQLADLRAQRATQSIKLAAIQKQLADAQSRLASIQGSAAPAPSPSGRRDLAGRLTAGVVNRGQTEGADASAPSPDLSQVQDEINTLRQQVSQGQSALSSLDAKIADLQAQIPMPPSRRRTNNPATTAPPSAPDTEYIPPL